MKSTKLFLLIPLFMLMAGYALGRPASDYQLIKNQNGISLYERWIPAANENKVRELKTVFTVKSTMTSIRNLLTNQDQGLDWNTNASVYKIQPLAESENWLTYIKYGMPWPFSDQDCCLHYHLINKNNNTVVISFNSALDNRFPINKSTDRIAGVRGEWMLQDIGDGNIKITYFITTDRSKKIPRWISDPVVHNNLFSTMTSFKNLLEG